MANYDLWTQMKDLLNQEVDIGLQGDDPSNAKRAADLVLLQANQTDGDLNTVDVTYINSGFLFLPDKSVTEKMTPDELGQRLAANLKNTDITVQAGGFEVTVDKNNQLTNMNDDLEDSAPDLNLGTDLSSSGIMPSDWENDITNPTIGNHAIPDDVRWDCHQYDDLPTTGGGLLMIPIPDDDLSPTSNGKPDSSVEWEVKGYRLEDDILESGDRLLSYNSDDPMMRGEDVLALQNDLQRLADLRPELGITLGDHGADGVFGPDTRAALIIAEKHLNPNLDPTGTADGGFEQEIGHEIKVLSDTNTPLISDTYIPTVPNSFTM